MQPLISLCMIVRNEAHCLGQCLASVRDSVDEIIVVDTGSDDASPDIARAFNARVLRHAWDDDFSTPRNVSLDHANGRWVLLLDADEALAVEDKPKLKTLTKSNEVHGYRFLIRMHPEWTEMYGLRLFRNSPSLRFKGIYHESLTIPESDRRNFIDSDIRILHTPWSPEISKTKYERNVRLLRKHIATYPEDLYQILDLTRLYLESDRLIDAETMLEQAAKVFEKQRYGDEQQKFYGAYLYLYRLQLMKKKNCAAADRLALCREALTFVSCSPPFLHEAAHLCYHLKQYEKALAYFRQCLELGSGAAFDRSIMFPRDIIGAASLACMGHCYFKLRTYEQAADCFRRSLVLQQNPKIKSMLHAALLRVDPPTIRGTGSYNA